MEENKDNRRPIIRYAYLPNNSAVWVAYYSKKTGFYIYVNTRFSDSVRREWLQRALKDLEAGALDEK